MPRTTNGANRRQSIRIPVLMIEEINRIVREYPELHYNGQHFVECAIREKIEKTQLIKAINSEFIREDLLKTALKLWYAIIFLSK